MGQIFPRSANIIAGVSIVVVIGLVGTALAFLILSPMSYTPAAPSQPVPFSHQQHAGNLGINCEYCHTSVETSAFAGMPSAQVCMNCHSEVLSDNDELAPVRDAVKNNKPLIWNRVYTLPDFVYFDHSAHVNKGVACVSCHGQIDQMAVVTQAVSLQMSWCMNCHTHPDDAIRPRDEVTNMEWQPPADIVQIRQQLITQYNVQSETSCSTCHR